MFRSLTAKLIVAFGVVTFVSLVAASAGFLYLLRDREVAAARERVGLIVQPLQYQVQQLARAGYSADYIASFLSRRAQEFGVRTILVDQSMRVVADSSHTLQGKQLEDASGQDLAKWLHERREHQPEGGFIYTTWVESGRTYVVFGVPGSSSTVVTAPELVPQQYGVVVAVPAGTIQGAWLALAPRLALAALVAAVLSVAVAAVVARSVTRPLARMTRASAAMARGEYDQRIPESGHDEVGRLSRAFNHMAREVSRSHRSMRDLLANVAHELKTPLTSIQGFSQALSEGAARTDADRSIATRAINEEADRMRTLIEDLLDLSRIEAGMAPLDLTRVDLGELLRGTVERLSPMVARGGRTVRVDAPAAGPAVRGDARRLEQVAANLVQNAIRHAQAGGVVTLRALQAEPQTAEFAVHNTGSYIAPEDRERIFERFYQVDRARSRNGRAGGLGLAIAREVVAAHEGTIRVESDRDTGTTFRVVLPTRGPSAPSDRAAAKGKGPR